jgi:hypothetical protein
VGSSTKYAILFAGTFVQCCHSPIKKAGLNTDCWAALHEADMPIARLNKPFTINWLQMHKVLTSQHCASIRIDVTESVWNKD